MIINFGSRTKRLMVGPRRCTGGRHLGAAFVVLVACATLVNSSLKAQQTSAQEISSQEVAPTFTLQSERNLVTVRVVVRDGKGRTVDNLRQEDFQLFDRGKRQTIAHFSVENSTAHPADTSAPKPLPGSGTAEKSSAGFQAPRRFVALYFDDVNTLFEDLTRSRDAADRFLRVSFRPGDRVGVFTASGLKPLDFTDDLAEVHQALSNLHTHPLIPQEDECGEILPYQAYLIIEAKDPVALSLAAQEQRDCGNVATAPTSPMGGAPQGQSNNSGSAQGQGGGQSSGHNSGSSAGGILSASPDTIEAQELVQSEAQRALYEARTRSQAVLQGIDSLVRLMTTLPGQRSLVVVSDGFLTKTMEPALARISDRALRANVIINGLDARGVYVRDMIADASKGGSAAAAGSTMLAEKSMMQTEDAQQQTEGMGNLALDTGGILFANSNDLEAGFRQAAAAPDTYYTLAFSPQDLKHDGAFHAIKVAVLLREGFAVQARRGYYAPRKSEDLAEQQAEEIQDAAFSREEMQGLPMQVDTQYFMITRADAEIDVVTRLDLHPVHFQKRADRNLDNLTVVTAIFDQDGRFVAGKQKSLELHLRDASLERYLSTGIRVETDFQVKPGTYLIRAVVRDSDSGQISALNRTLAIPY